MALLDFFLSRKKSTANIAKERQLEQKDGDISILELNVTLPEAEESR
ncbi:cell division topological specificity factor MinE [Enterobacter cloacae]|nr:cell division topological specificity factor MinE [Enterobacter cloacae]